MVEMGLADSEIAAEVRQYPAGVGSSYAGKEKQLGAEISRIRSKVRGPAEPSIEPYDIFGDTRLAGAPDLPAGAVPDVIENFARDEATRLGVECAMIALPAVVACAASIDDGWSVQPKRHDTRWTESPRLSARTPTTSICRR